MYSERFRENFVVITCMSSLPPSISYSKSCDRIACNSKLIIIHSGSDLDRETDDDD